MNLENRIKRRIFMELDGYDDIGEMADRWRPVSYRGVYRDGQFLDVLDTKLGNYDSVREEDGWFEASDTARIAALEAEDTANPLAATAVVRRDLQLAPVEPFTVDGVTYQPEETR